MFLCSLLVVGLFVGGCATPGKRVLLKEYGPTAPQEAGLPLKGVTVCVKTFGESFNINDTLSDTNTIEPAGYVYQPMTPEQKEMWHRDLKIQEKSSNEKDWKEIGYLRGMFGGVSGKVYAVDSPGKWLADTLKQDLREQGAQIVDASQVGEPTVSIGGTIRYFKIDMYMVYWADLVVDVQVQINGKPPIERTFHTSTDKKQTAWTGSSLEFYQSIRQCQQKFSQAVIAEVIKALKN